MLGSEHMTFSLKDSEKNILKEIAINGERTRYDLFKVASSSTIHNALKKFKDSELLEVVREERFEKTGEMKKFYGLTFRGLIAALKIEDVKLRQIKNREELAVRWINPVQKLVSELKISRILGNTSTERKKRIQVFRNLLIQDMREGSTDLESFLKHYDLDYSSNTLIFDEWMWKVGKHNAGKNFSEVLEHE